MALLPALIITGASGFVGRHLLDEFKNDFRIFALARRTQRECGAPVHSNIAWMQVDIGDSDALTKTFHEIVTAGGAQYLIHLAAYYDFSGEDHPEYRRTNVDGTRNVLELSRQLRLKRFVFASSVAACAFPSADSALTEDSPPDGDHVYAWSKRQGEFLLNEYAQVVPSCIVRFGAIYSDWCEYAPLYMFLQTWLGTSWRARILAGKGESAIPYIHIREIVAFFRQLLAHESELSPREVMLACTDGATSHRELFDQATRMYFGRAKSPINVPAILAKVGVTIMNWLVAIRGERPFERPWMIRYVDRQLTVEATRTAAKLGWRREPRLRVERRMPFLLERLKNEPLQWHARNMAVVRRTTERPDLLLYNALAQLEDKIVTEAAARWRSDATPNELAGYLEDKLSLSWYTRLVYRLVIMSIQSGNRLLLLEYFEVSAASRFALGQSGDGLCQHLQVLHDTALRHLHTRPELTKHRQDLFDRLTLPFEMAKDEICEQYSRYVRGERPRQPMPESKAQGDTPRQILEETIWKCLVHRQ